MYIVIYILSGLAGIVVLLLIIGLFSKKSYLVQREIVVDRPVAVVFDYLRYLKNQDHFNSDAKKDLGRAETYTGVDGTVGFIIAWDGNKDVGKGEKEITGIIEGKRVDIEMRFVRPFALVAQTPFTTEDLGGNKTRVTWSLSATLKYPMNVMLIFMNMDKTLGKGLEESLVTMKKLVENQS